MQTKSKTIEMDNGIIITVVATDDGTTTNITTTVENMDILLGQEISHVGGRPKNPK